MFEIDSKVFFQALEESPKFRRTFIRQHIKLNKQLVARITEHYCLQLIDEIYFIEINVNTYNSQKRKKLKKQEIILIKKIIIFEGVRNDFIKLEDNVKKYENAFSSYFHQNFKMEGDSQLAEEIINELLFSFCQEQEYCK